MAYVPIPKDLKKVKTKVAFNLTKRQLIGFTIAGLIGIPIYLFMRKVVPNDIAVIFLLSFKINLLSHSFLWLIKFMKVNILKVFLKAKSVLFKKSDEKYRKC